MKKTSICLALLLLSMTLNAAVKKNSLFINTELNVGGEKLSPLMLVQDGAKGAVESESLRFEVTPSLRADGTVLLKTKVFKYEGNGKRKLVSEPSIITRLGEKALVVVGADDGTKLSMSVTASLEE